MNAFNRKQVASQFANLLKLCLSSASIAIFIQSLLVKHGLDLFLTLRLPIFFLTSFASLLLLSRTSSLLFSKWTGASPAIGFSKDASTYLFSLLLVENLFFKEKDMVLYVFNRFVELEYILLVLCVFLILVSKLAYVLKLRKDIPAEERGNKAISWHATVAPIILTVVAFMLGVGVAFESARRKSDELNVVLICIDSLRPDHTTFSSGRNETTPFLKQFAKENILFENAISQASFTLPSLVSLLTSMYPSSLNVLTLEDRYILSAPTMAEILRDDGYLTHGISSSFFSSNHVGLHRGFMSHVVKLYVRGDVLTQNALKWVRKNRYRKFFLFIHYLDPHWNYSPPRSYAFRFRGDYAGTITGSYYDIYKFQDMKKYNLKNRDLEHVKNLYDGEIAYLDDCLKKLFDELGRLGLDDHTLVVITSDHGEEFLDHQGMGHGRSVYDELIRVVLIMKIPKVAEAGKIVRQQVQMLDVLPTVLEALNIDKPDNLQGHSVLSLIRNGEKEARGDRYAFSVSRYGEGRIGKTSVRSENFKLVHYETGEEEFYNLKTDPLERTNLIDRDIPEIDELRDALREYEETNYRVRKKYGSTATTYNERDLQKIRDLGYIE